MMHCAQSTMAPGGSAAGGAGFAVRMIGLRPASGRTRAAPSTDPSSSERGGVGCSVGGWGMEGWDPASIASAVATSATTSAATSARTSAHVSATVFTSPACRSVASSRKSVASGRSAGNASSSGGGGGCSCGSAGDGCNGGGLGCDGWCGEDCGGGGGCCAVVIIAAIGGGFAFD